jgi:hypothetical protein
MPARRPAKQTRAGSVPWGRPRGWRSVTTISVLAVVVLGVAGVATAQIVSRLRSPGHASASAPAATPSVRPADVTGTPGGPVSPSSAPATRTLKPTPSATPKPPPAVTLAVSGASAFGPSGVTDGDNPQDASYVITPGAGLPWKTDWYMTAKFGMLAHGTGLMLDMGKTVTVTGVQIRLGSISGATLEVRAGTGASLSAAPVVASAADAGGTLILRLKTPARARYVIIWFTQLPPNGAGKYQAFIYSVAVTGRP